MKSLLKKTSMSVLGLASCAIALSTSTSTAQAANTNLYLTVSGGIITIGAPASGTMGTISVSSTAVPISYTFGAGNEFWLEDMKGTDQGYYTTIQSSSFSGSKILLNPSATIPSSAVSIQILNNLIGATPMVGTPNVGVKANSAASYLSFTNISSPVTFIERKNGTNLGIIGKYGVLPTFKVTVPAYTPIDTYTAVVTYTLYDATNP